MYCSFGYLEGITLKLEVFIMSKLLTKSVIYFELSRYRALKIKAAATHQSVSELVNEVMRFSLYEEQEDLAVFEERKGEPTLSSDELLEYLKVHDKL